MTIRISQENMTIKIKLTQLGDSSMTEAMNPMAKKVTIKIQTQFKY